MRDDVFRAIRAAYPSGRYDERDTTMLDRAVTVDDIRTLIGEIEALQQCETFVVRDDNYSTCYEIQVAQPNRETVWRIDRLGDAEKRKLRDAPPTYLMTLHVSRLGRFYTLAWNAFRLEDGRSLAVYQEDPPAELKDFHVAVMTILRSQKFEKLSQAQISEPVSDISPGQSTIESPVTVGHCLFSEEF